MKVYGFWIILCLSTLLSGCRLLNDKTISVFPEQSFMEVIESEEVIDPSGLSFPQSVLKLNKGMLVYDIDGDYFLKYIKDEKGNEPVSVAKRGLGPLEFINVRNMNFDVNTASLFLYDSQQKKARLFHPEDSTFTLGSEHLEVEYDLSHTGGKEAQPFLNGVLMNGVFGNNMFIMTDSTGTVITEFGDFPGDKTGIDNPQEFFMKNENIIFSNPSKKRFVAAGAYTDWLVFFDLSQGVPRKLEEYFSYDSSLGTSTDGNTTSSELGDETILSYKSLTGSESSVYALYDGRRVKDAKEGAFEYSYIMQFSWDGEFEKGYKIPERLLSISVDSTGKKLYGIAYDGENTYMKCYDL